MKRRYYIVGLLALLCCSCQNQKGEEGKVAVVVEKDLQAEVLFTSDDLGLSTPRECWLINDSILVTQQLKQETHLDVWNIRTRQHRNQFLKRGQGPTEFFFPLLSFSEREKSFYAYENGRKSMYKIDQGELMKPVPRIERVLQWDLEANPSLYPEQMYYIGKNTYFSVNSTDTARFMIQTPEAFKLFGEYPDKDKVDPKLTPMANASLYKYATVAISPDYKKVMVFQDYADMITLIDLKGKEPVVSSKINAYPNGIKLLAGGEDVVYALISDDTYIYYMSPCGTKDYVYVLWNGNEWRNELNSHNILRSKTIKVFDWDGNLRYILHIDKPVRAISVSSDNKTLIATSDQNDYEIYRYQLDLD